MGCMRHYIQLVKSPDIFCRSVTSIKEIDDVQATERVTIQLSTFAGAALRGLEHISLLATEAVEMSAQDECSGAGL